MSEVFRKKSLDRVNSPEDLNEYMRVTNPPIWFAIIAIILLLCGAIFWGATTKLETTAQAVAVNTDSGIICYISSDDISDVTEGTIVRINKEEYSVTEIGKGMILPNDALTDYEMSLGGFENGETVYAVTLSGDAITMSAKADVVLEEVSPISFLFSSSN